MATPTTSIDALPLKASPQEADGLIIQDAGVTKRTTVAGLAAVVGSDTPGPPGPPGAAGAPGPAGPGLNILGTLSGTDTPLPTSPQEGDMWLIGDPVPDAIPDPEGGTKAVGDAIVWNNPSTSTAPVVPGTPTGLAATVAPAAGVGSGQVRLNWVSPVSGGSPILDYVIEQSTDSITWTVASDAVSSAVTSTLSGLTDDTLYYFRIYAVNAVGAGPTTTAVTGTPNNSVLLSAPLTPLRLTAAVAPTPGVVSGQVLLTWNEPPAVPPVNCALDPGLYGYPDTTNTGYAPGTSFLRVPDEATSGTGWVWNPGYLAVFPTTPGITLEGLDITGGIVVDVPNVTITNCRVSACGLEGDCVVVRYNPSDLASYNGANVHVIHNTLIGSPPGCTARTRSGVRDTYGQAIGMYIDGNDISGCGNGISVEREAIVVNNWVHDIGHYGDDHHSGISTHGGATQIIWQHNTVLFQFHEAWAAGGISGPFTIYSDFAHAQNVTVEDNLMSGGAYCCYGGGSWAGVASTNIKYFNNRIVYGSWDYGPLSAWDPTSSGNEWEGNVSDQDGTELPPFLPFT